MKPNDERNDDRPQEASLDAFCLLGADGEIIFVTEASREILGYAPEELIGQSALRFVHPDEHSRLSRFYARAARGGAQGSSTLLRCMHKNGEWTTVECVAKGSDQTSRTAVELRPPTRIEVAANQALDEYEQFRLIADYARDLILVIDPEGTILWASPSHATIMGRHPSEIVNHKALDFVHPDDRDRQRQVLSERVEERRWKTIELRVGHADGHWLEFESLGVPIIGPSGAVEKIVISARDITARKELERRVAMGEAQLQTILAQIPATVWTTDRDLRITSCLGGGLRDLGFESSQVVGLQVEQCVSPDRQAAVELIHRRAMAGETMAHEAKWNDRDLFVRLQPLFDAGEIVGTIGITLDVSHQRRAERRFRTLFERNLAGVFRATLEGLLLECNGAFARMFGYNSPEEMTGIRTPDLYYDPEDRDEVLAAIQGRPDLINVELRLRRRDGQLVWGLLNESLIRGEGGHGDLVEGTMIDITDRKRAEERIEYQAFHDSLTDLPNRFLFNDRLGLAIAQARRHRTSLAVMFLDLDGFKLINDTMAHTAGDDLLRKVADRLRSVLRSVDTVARVGGDEFIFILPEIEEAAAAARVARKVLDEIRAPFVIHDRELYVTASIGIALFPTDGNDIETLVKNADGAMYRAKEAGRNNYQFHTPLAQRGAEVRLTLETALRRALEREEFFLVYQPQIHLATGTITGFEALLRWEHPGVGTVAPMDFIPLAEEIGIIVPIGEWVLRKACRQMQQWIDATGRPMRVAVNLSPRQFQHEKLTRIVEDALGESDLNPRCLELEITESLSMGNSDLTLGRLSHFRSLGISVSLDDFGTGYSSLSHLRSLPIDSLKIDRSFITDLKAEGPERTIIQAIIIMAQSLSLRVIAEGVETDEQQTLLTQLGCDEMQGFVFSRPLAVGAALELLLR